jgi:hypothetical protein
VSTPTTELTKQVQDAARPNVSFENQKLMVYNSTINYAGRPTWNPMTIKLRDDVTGAVSKLGGEQMQKQFDFFEQSSAAAGGDYKFLMRVEMLDGGNGGNEAVVLERWELYGCYLSSADYGDSNYGTNDPMTIALTIRYDNAIQTPVGTGVGSVVARTLGSTITG